MIEIEGLTVRFGGVTPIRDMNLVFPAGVCGLIGPNGAGKTTFFNVLSGFVRPAEGQLRAFGQDLLRMPGYRRARWGMRRTFQTEQAIERLSVYENVAMVHEHTGGRRSKRRADVLTALELAGLDVAPAQFPTFGFRPPAPLPLPRFAPAAAERDEVRALTLQPFFARAQIRSE